MRRRYLVCLFAFLGASPAPAEVLFDDLHLAIPQVSAVIGDPPPFDVYPVDPAVQFQVAALPSGDQFRVTEYGFALRSEAGQPDPPVQFFLHEDLLGQAGRRA